MQSTPFDQKRKGIVIVTVLHMTVNTDRHTLEDTPTLIGYHVMSKAQTHTHTHRQNLFLIFF